MIQLGLALVMVFTIYTLGAPYMQRVLHRSPNDISIAPVPAMVGLVAMAGVLGQHLITLARRSLTVLALLTTGLCLVAMGVLPPVFQAIGADGLMLPVVVALALAFGAALGAILIPAFTVLQEGTTEELRGRIFGGVFTVINASIALPLLAFGGRRRLLPLGQRRGGRLRRPGARRRALLPGPLLAAAGDPRPAGPGHRDIPRSGWQPLTRRCNGRVALPCQVRSGEERVASSPDFARRGGPAARRSETVEAQGERCEPS